MSNTKTFEIKSETNGCRLTYRTTVDFDARTVETHTFGLDAIGQLVNHRTRDLLAVGYTPERIANLWTAQGWTEVA